MSVENPVQPAADPASDRAIAGSESAPRIILITGVSSGLGRAMAREALSRGDTVIGTVRQQRDLDEFEAIAPGRAIGRLLDMSDTAGIGRVSAFVESEVGPLDVLINNAGYGLAGAIEELSIDDLRREFEVDVFGQIAMTQAVLPGMRARRRGRIINIVSMGGVITFPTNGAYHGAKFALLGMSDSLAKEVAPLGIAVTSVLPGMYDTDWGGRSRTASQGRIDDYDQFHAAAGQVQMTGDPARLARVVIDLLDADEPPMRLLVGHTAVVMVREELARQNAEIDRWETTSDTDGYG